MSDSPHYTCSVLRVIAAFGILLALIGLFNLAEAGISAIRYFRGYPSWTHTQATIVRVYRERSEWHAVYRVGALTLDRPLAFAGRRTAPFAQGQTIEIVYPPSNPRGALFNIKADLLNDTWTTAILGLLFLIFGWVMAAIAMTRPIVEAMPARSGKKRRRRNG